MACAMSPSAQQSVPVAHSQVAHLRIESRAHEPHILLRPASTVSRDWRCRGTRSRNRTSEKSLLTGSCKATVAGTLAAWLLHVRRAASLKPTRMQAVVSASRPVRKGVRQPIDDDEACVVLLRGKERYFQEEGVQIIYKTSVSSVYGDPQAGSLVKVLSSRGQLLGWGVFNPHSLYQVRVLANAEEGKALFAGNSSEEGFLEQLLEQRFRAALALRRILGLPRPGFDEAYRLINGEGDRVSGLSVDIYRKIIVVRSSALWVERHREIIRRALLSLFNYEDGEASLVESSQEEPFRLVWRGSYSHLNVDGVAFLEAQPEAQVEVEPDEEFVVREAGIPFLVKPAAGQKTGLYLDQRENRRMLHELVALQAESPRVLDLCCYQGAFSLAALAGGASEVVAVDSSAEAVELVRRNAELTPLSARALEEGFFQVHQADIKHYLQDAQESGLSFDIIVLDPPKLAPSRKPRHLARAEMKYFQLNKAAMRVLQPGGLLLTCTCSSAMTQSGMFTSVVASAATAIGRDVTVLRTRQAAADHPISPSCQEGSYLTALLVRVT